MRQLILFLCFLPVILHAQNSNTTRLISNTRPAVTKEQRDSIFKHSDFIFEAERLLVHNTKVPGHLPSTAEEGFSGMSVLFKVSKVLKGSNEYIGEIIEVHASYINVTSGFVTIGDNRNIVFCNMSATQTSYFNIEEVNAFFQKHWREYSIKNESSFEILGSINEARGRGILGLGYFFENYQFAIDSLLTEYPELEVLPKPPKSKREIEEEKVRRAYWKQKNEENLRKIFVNDSLRHEKMNK